MPDSAKIVGEKSTWYLYSEVAAENINTFEPDAKCIAMVRNPVDLAHSLHSQLLKSKNSKEDICDFETAWNAQGERMKGERLPPNCPEPKMLQYGKVCKLGAQIERVLEHFPRERVFIIFYDDLKKDPKKVYENTFRFLNLPCDNRLHFPVINKNKNVSFPLLRRYAFRLARLKERLGIKVGFGILTSFVNATIQEKERQQLSDDFRSELTEYFTEDVKKLSKLTGRNLSNWYSGN